MFPGIMLFQTMPEASNFHEKVAMLIPKNI